MLNQIAAIHGTGAPPIPVTPVAGYSLWLDAADTATISVSGTAVTGWTDKSANAYQFNQTTSTNRPVSGVNTINSKNVIRFDGTNDTLVSTAAASTWTFLQNTQYTFFVVAKKVGGDGTWRNYFGTSAGGSTQTGANYGMSDTNKYAAIVWNGTSGQQPINAEAADSLSTSPIMVTNLIDPSNGTAANRWKFTLNDGSQQTPNTKTDAVSSTTPPNTLNIGSSNWGNFNGDIAEIVLYQSLLSSGDIANVKTYLNNKWAVY